MGDFFKTIGQGVLYLIFSPFILAGVALYAVYALILFFIYFIKRIVLFFKGEDMHKEMRMDVVAKMHLNNQDEAKEARDAALENAAINIPATNVVKEEKTTIVQPIIIQTDEEGRLKNVSYLNPTPGQQSPQIQVQNNSMEAIEAKKEEKEDD